MGSTSHTQCPARGNPKNAGLVPWQTPASWVTREARRSSICPLYSPAPRQKDSTGTGDLDRSLGEAQYEDPPEGSCSERMGGLLQCDQRYSTYLTHGKVFASKQSSHFVQAPARLLWNDPPTLSNKTQPSVGRPQPGAVPLRSRTHLPSQSRDQTALGG